MVDLPKGAMLYEPGERIRYTYFPHDAIVSLVDVKEDERVAEVALFGGGVGWSPERLYQRGSPLTLCGARVGHRLPNISRADG